MAERGKYDARFVPMTIVRLHPPVEQGTGDLLMGAHVYHEQRPKCGYTTAFLHIKSVHGEAPMVKGTTASIELRVPPGITCKVHSWHPSP